MKQHADPNSHLTPERIIDYVHRALAPDEDALIFAHLGRCAACRLLHDEEVALGELLRERAAYEERDLPEAVRLGVLEAILPTRLKRRRLGHSLWLGWLWPVGGAAFAAACFSIAQLHTTPTVQPQVALTSYLTHHAAAATEMPFADRLDAGIAENDADLLDDRDTPNTSLSAEQS